MTHNIQEIWKSSHRLLVSVFASPYAENLIRSTRRLADTLNASWIGAYIDDNHPLSSEEKTLLARNIALVQELGGEVITSREEDTAEGLLRIARQNNVTEIVIGKSGRSWWNSFFSGGSLVNRLLRSADDIDIYSISYQREDGKKNTQPLPETSPYTLPIHEMGIIAALLIG
jgi:two-component system sensor histidine kinase KdpD